MHRYAVHVVGRLLIAALLLAQFAVSAHACMGMAMTMTADQAVVAIDGEDGGTAAMDAAVCAAHCQQGDQSAAHLAAPDLPPALLHPLYAVPAPGSLLGALPLAVAAVHAVAAAPPPTHAILHCCWRI